MAMTSKQRNRLKQAFAGFDEINTFWVDKMDLPSVEKQIRVEMMRDFQKQLESVPKPSEDKRNVDYILLAALGYMAYKALYKEFAQKYYRRYLRACGASGDISDFAVIWINDHADIFADYSHTNLVASARTETNALCSLAQLDAYQQLGYEGKQWLTMGDSRVRPTHREAAGQVRLLQEPFLIGDSFMMFPQDSSLGASAKEIVNCRCTMRPVKTIERL